MHPEFGVGLKKYLFSNFDEGAQGAIETRIYDQVLMYMPAVSISTISFVESPDTNILAVIIYYTVPGISMQDMLKITI